MDLLLHSRTLQRPDGRLQTCSGGLAKWPADAGDIQAELVRIADAPMYQTKIGGKAPCSPRISGGLVSGA